MFWLIGGTVVAWWIFRLRHGLENAAVENTTCDAESSAHGMMQDESVRVSLLDSIPDLDTEEHDELNVCATNPANGLPMMGCVDIAGNFYGSDSSHHVFQDDSFLSSNMFDDTFSSSSFSSFDD